MIQTSTYKHNPCATLLYKMGIESVAFSFENALVDCEGHVSPFTVNPYTDETRQNLVVQLANKIPEDVYSMIVSLIQENIDVTILTLQNDVKNGNVVKNAYHFDGVDLVLAVLSRKFGKELMKYIQVDTVKSFFKRRHVHHRGLVVSADKNVLEKATQKHLLTIGV